MPVRMGLFDFLPCCGPRKRDDQVASPYLPDAHLHPYLLDLAYLQFYSC